MILDNAKSWPKSWPKVLVLYEYRIGKPYSTYKCWHSPLICPKEPQFCFSRLLAVMSWQWPRSTVPV